MNIAIYGHFVVMAMSFVLFQKVVPARRNRVLSGYQFVRHWKGFERRWHHMDELQKWLQPAEKVQRIAYRILQGILYHVSKDLPEISIVLWRFVVINADSAGYNQGSPLRQSQHRNREHLHGKGQSLSNEDKYHIKNQERNHPPSGHWGTDKALWEHEWLPNVVDRRIPWLEHPQWHCQVNCYSLDARISQNWEYLCSLLWLRHGVRRFDICHRFSLGN